MYQAIDAAMVRAAQLPCTVDSVGWPDLAGDTDAHVAHWRAWLQKVWAIEDFATAVELASPVLAGRVHTVCRDPHRSAGDVRRTAVSVVRYLLRATGRPTPFGSFAGIAAARFDRSTKVCWGRRHRAVARVDAEWLDAVLTQLESDPELRRRLSVVANSTATVRDGRLVLGWQRRPDATTVGGPGEVSVRHTNVVQLLMRHAAAPIRVRDVITVVAAEVNAPEAALDQVLTVLIEQGFLITRLRPLMTATDPLAHVVAVLDEAEADTVPGVAERVVRLRALNEDMVEHNTSDSPSCARERRDMLSRAMTEIAPNQRPMGMDLRLDCDLTLPNVVRREAEAAATALVRLAPQPFGTPEWQQYHGRFIERYGPRAVVPVTELVADTGIGFPTGYRGTPWAAPAERPFSQRDATLMEWAQHAAWQQSTELVLDNTMIAGLAVADSAEVAVQPHTELRVRVHAPTREALDRGEFELAVAGASRSAGVTAGRFLDLFDADDHHRMISSYAALPTVCDNASVLQVSAPALSSRTDNVARSPHVLPVVSLGEHRDPAHTVALDDLAVTADAERLVLISLSDRRPVEPLMFSAVEMVHHGHPLARFLTEISTARTAPCAPFSWGHAARLPFLPRVRYRRTILAPARWRLDAADLPETTASWVDWVLAFQDWQRRFAVPDTVYLGDSDRRMRLHLPTEAHLYLIRTELSRNGSVVLREAPADEAFGWFDGHAHEVVIPLAATTTKRPAPSCSAQPIRREHGHLPGSESWLYLKLYAHPDRQDAILVGHIRELLSAWDAEPEWWFLRYQDPDPHLRLRFRPRQLGDTARAAKLIGTWVDGLRRLGLVGHAQFDTYYPETGRFGTDEAMCAAESVFATDSRAVLAQLRTAEHRVVPSLALASASMVNLACSFHDTPAGGMRWLSKHARTPSGPAPERVLRDQALQLADPHNGWAAAEAALGAADVVAAWRERQANLTSYRSVLEERGQHEPRGVLADLLHLHHVRMFGVGIESERACLRLARAAALSWTARTEGAA